jgi:glycosyltransferase involved in cell wall biosynthesis
MVHLMPLHHRPVRRIIFTVTNDLVYDQRMQRCCRTLTEAGFEVTLLGRAKKNAPALSEQPFRQHRLRCWAEKGPQFYLEYNLRLFLFLLAAPFDAVGTVDLDTMPGGALAAWLRRKKRVFDAHEYFTEVPEVSQRHFVKAVWAAIGRWMVPLYHRTYTVGPGLAAIFTQLYGLPFAVVRNVPTPLPYPPLPPLAGPPILLYQGALNEGRGIEAALEALTLLPPEVELWIAGEGDLSAKLRRLAGQLGVTDRAKFLGYVCPADLPALTRQAWLGLNLLENKGLSYYYSLANKFFDSVQAGVPMLTMNFPEYRALNQTFEVAILLDHLTPSAVADAVLRLLRDPAHYQHLQQQCHLAREQWHWKEEQKVLLEVWNSV